jgi:hypothetical protein
MHLRNGLVLDDERIVLRATDHQLGAWPEPSSLRYGGCVSYAVSAE